MAKDSGNLSVGFLYDDSLDRNDGVSHQVKTLGSWLGSQKHDVSYLVGETKIRQWAGGTVYSLARNINVSFNKNILSVPLPANRAHIKQLLSSKHFDVLHVQMPYSPFMAQKVIHDANPNTAIVGTFHILPASWLAAWGSRFLRLMYGQSLKRFDQVISVSPAAAEFAKQVFGLDSIIIPNTVSTQIFTGSTYSYADNPKPKIVFLGRLVKRKGCLELLRAVALLRKKKPQVHLVMAGDGPLRSQLERFVKQNNLEANVEFLGYVEEKNKPQLLASANVACFPSLAGESFGIVLIEAMAAGANVVLGGDNPGYRSVLGDQPLLLIDPHQSQQFADRLELLLTDLKLIRSLNIWQQTAVEQYDVDIVGPRLLKVYRQAIVKRQTKGHN